MSLPAVTDLSHLSDADLQHLAVEILGRQRQDRQQNQLFYYQPVSATARQIHLSTAKTIGIGGGNGSSKSESMLVELCIRATGCIPESLAADYPREKLTGPIACRLVCESLTTTLVPIILPKLQWWRWSGIGQPGSTQGHWGWIPKDCLIGGEWKTSWTDRLRILRLFYRDPDTRDILGESSIQFNSYDQDASDFASGDFHFVGHDEPPKWDIWRENRARVMRVDGTLMLAMTWPDDPTIAVDWIFDEIYEKAQPGPAKDPAIDWFNLYTTDNPHLNQAAVQGRAAQMSDTERQVRIYGQPIRFSCRVHPDFTDHPRTWCVDCGKDVIAVGSSCGTCGGGAVFSYCHVTPLVAHPEWPVIFTLDPHPRKPHMMAWTQITPNDDLEQLHEALVAGGPEEVATLVTEIESDYGWDRVQRLIDPNMGRSPSSAKRGVTWQEEFEQVGVVCDLADDADVGRARFNDYLKPDRLTGAPRWHVDPRCTQTILQLKRYCWDDYRLSADKGMKQTPKALHDDYPTQIKYLMNTNPSFRGLKSLGQIVRRMGERGRHGY